MRFQVPQFINVEDKIFGPLTLKQFIFLAGGAGLSFIIYRFLGLFFGIIFIAPAAGLALALAFYKVNGKPFIQVMESAFKYWTANKLFIWHKEPKKPVEKDISEKDDQAFIPKLSDSKLKELTWSLDIKESDTRN